MPVLAKMALAVVAGGIGLGTMLGSAANPVMKRPPAQPWQGALQAPVAADPGYKILVEAGPEDLSPYRDSYAPTWAREEVANWEPVYPEWTYSELADESLAVPSLAVEPKADQQRAPATPDAPVVPGASLPPVEPAAIVPEPAAAETLAALY